MPIKNVFEFRSKRDQYIIEIAHAGIEDGHGLGKIFTLTGKELGVTKQTFYNIINGHIEDDDCSKCAGAKRSRLQVQVNRERALEILKNARS